MKKLLIAAGAVASVVAVPAAAQNSVEIPLQGTLGKTCGISAFLNGPFDALNLSSTARQGDESVSINCNYGGSASVEFASANSGNLKSGSNLVPYTFFLTGAGSPFSGGVSLATPQTWNGFPAVVGTNQTRSMSVALNSVATVAGTYTDIITATVTPN